MDLQVKVMAQEKDKVKESGFGIASIQVAEWIYSERWKYWGALLLNIHNGP